MEVIASPRAGHHLSIASKARRLRPKDGDGKRIEVKASSYLQGWKQMHVEQTLVPNHRTLGWDNVTGFDIPGSLRLVPGACSALWRTAPPGR